MICNYKPDGVIGPLMEDGRFYSKLPSCDVERAFWFTLFFVGASLLFAYIRGRLPHEQ